MNQLSKQLLDEVSRQIQGVEFKEMPPKYHKAIAAFVTDRVTSGMSETDRKVFLAGKPFALSPATMKKWKAGELEPSDDHLNLLSQYLGYSNFQEYKERKHTGKNAKHVTSQSSLFNFTFRTFSRIAAISILVILAGLLAASLSSAMSLAELKEAILNVIVREIPIRSEETTPVRSIASFETKKDSVRQDSHIYMPLKQLSTYTKEATVNEGIAEVIEIRVAIKYNGKPLQKAYFVVEELQIRSTLSQMGGWTSAMIPKKFTEENREYLFSVYAADSLLYSKHRTFKNLELDAYP